MKIAQPFHDGEILIQNELNEQDTALLNGSLYEDSVMVPAHKFLTQQSFLIVSASETSTRLPISVLYGEPGFLQLQDSGKKLIVTLKSHTNLTQDPVLSRLKIGTQVGTLAIELSTRRRLRINGHIDTMNDRQLTIVVAESYPNCPKYIQKRTLEKTSLSHSKVEILTSGKILSKKHRVFIESADTCFVSSFNPNGYADASHRGGAPGFIKVLNNGDLHIPDYPGNSLYNTFGNFKINPFAGLLFWDFENCEFLHLYGSVLFDFKDNDAAAETGGTARWWTFQTASWELQNANLPFKMQFKEYSPFNPKAKGTE